MKEKYLLILFSLVFVLFGCKSKTTETPVTANVEQSNVSVPVPVDVNRVVQKGDLVEVEYTGKLNDGKVFDTSKNKAPLKFEVGSGQIIPGFDKAILGMHINEEKTFTVKTEDAYGPRSEKLIQQIPRKVFPATFELKEGIMVKLQDQSGRPIPATVLKFDDQKVTVDLNSPLAGKDLNFEIKILNIQNAPVKTMQ